MAIAISLSFYNVALFHLVNHTYYKGVLFLGVGAIFHAVSDLIEFRKYVGPVKKVFFFLWKILPLMVFIFYVTYYIIFIIFSWEIFLDLPWINRVILLLFIPIQFYTYYLLIKSLKLPFYSRPNEFIEKFIIWMNNCGTFLVIIIITFIAFTGIRLEVIDNLIYLGIPYFNILFISFISFLLPITYFRGIIHQYILKYKSGYYTHNADFFIQVDFSFTFVKENINWKTAYYCIFWVLMIAFFKYLVLLYLTVNFIPSSNTKLFLSKNVKFFNKVRSTNSGMFSLGISNLELVLKDDQDVPLAKENLPYYYRLRYFRVY